MAKSSKTSKIFDLASMPRPAFHLACNPDPDVFCGWSRPGDELVCGLDGQPLVLGSVEGLAAYAQLRAAGVEPGEVRIVRAKPCQGKPDRKVTP